jgi:divalent metal cation (Fe/Co/Zn/Cd) transporter
MEEQIALREAGVRRGIRLQYFTIIYNSLEGIISLAAGLFAGSVSLIGFGFDSLIEVTSGAAVLWRLRRDHHVARRETSERRAVRMVGWCFIALSIYILYESGSTLLQHDPPDRSIPGIIIAAVSIIVMPLLAAAKRRVAAEIGSAAVNADARQTDFCTYLSAILLCGLGLNALFGWWWADPVAALAMMPIIANEGIQSLKGKKCCDSCAAGVGPTQVSSGQ